jgi:hypothetical protein
MGRSYDVEWESLDISVFTIWREQSTGGYVLVAGDRPPTPGDICIKRSEVASWDVALRWLHQFIDQQPQNGAVT